MRYAGQNYELSVPACRMDQSGRTVSSALAEGFAAMHRRLYGFAADDEPVQMVTFRVEATGVVPKATLREAPLTGWTRLRRVTTRPVWLPEAGGFVPWPVYDRDRLAAGDSFTGPAIVEQMDATTFVPAGMTARVDAWLNLILEAA